MKKYYVTCKIDARYVVGVEADSIEEALKEADNRFSNAFFGEAEDIESEPIVVEDEKGNYVWERRT